MKAIPYVLTYSRLLMAMLFILIALFKPFQDPYLVVWILIAGITTDIFDGVIARWLKMDTVPLRQLDSKIDTVFWFSLIYAIVVLRPDFVKEYAGAIFTLVVFEIIVQITGYFKFSRSLALHTHAAKVWAVLLTVTIIQVLIGVHATFWFRISFLWGILVQIEVMAIILKLRTYRADIPSVFQLGTAPS